MRVSNCELCGKEFKGRGYFCSLVCFLVGIPNRVLNKIADTTEKSMEPKKDFDEKNNREFFS